MPVGTGPYLISTESETIEVQLLCPPPSLMLDSGIFTLSTKFDKLQLTYQVK
jgi:hypothetical protein